MAGPRAIADLRWSGLDLPLPKSGAVSFRIIGATSVPGTWSLWLQPRFLDIADPDLASAHFHATPVGDDVLMSLVEVGNLPEIPLRAILAVDDQPIASGSANRSWQHQVAPANTTIRVGDVVVPLEVGNVTIIGGGPGGDVISVNGQTGNVVLSASDVGADPLGSAAAVQDMIPDISGLVENTDPRLSDARTPLAHVHSQEDIVDLDKALAEKADLDDIPDVSGLVENNDPRLSDARIPLAHTHTQSDVDGLTGALAGKANIGDIPDISGLVENSDPRLSDSRTPLAHSHLVGDIDGLTGALAEKADLVDIPDISGLVETTDSRLSDARTPVAHSHLVGDIDPESTPDGYVVGVAGGQATWIAGPEEGPPGNPFPRDIQLKVSDPNGDPIETGNGADWTLVPEAWDGKHILQVQAGVVDPSATGDVQILLQRLRGETLAAITSDPVVIPEDNRSSYSQLPAELSVNTDLATGDWLRVDISQAGTGARGLVVVLTVGDL